MIDLMTFYYGIYKTSNKHNNKIIRQQQCILVHYMSTSTKYQTSNNSVRQ